jgi:hypothetical protein
MATNLSSLTPGLDGHVFRLGSSFYNKHGGTPRNFRCTHFSVVEYLIICIAKEFYFFVRLYLDTAIDTFSTAGRPFPSLGHYIRLVIPSSVYTFAAPRSHVA